ncbi:MAG: hypothetical protein NTY81_02355 [Candidatus Staskawiczbacteria bacterium]|nr:hypothetical protein [Candidatus Staskawiczbacteria bacterium]
MEKAEFTSAVKNVFHSCRDLSKLSGGMRKFTPDGRMVGDIGEVIAGVFYQIELHDVGRHDWDGTYNGRNVQIKATSGDGTYLKEPPEDGFADGLLMVFQIDRESGEYKSIYNGDIQRVWEALNNLKIDRTGAKMIPLDRLKELQKSVLPKDIIPEV